MVIPDFPGDLLDRHVGVFKKISGRFKTNAAQNLKNGIRIELPEGLIKPLLGCCKLLCKVRKTGWFAQISLQQLIGTLRFLVIRCLEFYALVCSVCAL